MTLLALFCTRIYCFKQLEQGQSRVLPNNAPKITFLKMKKLLDNMRLDIIKLRLSERRAIYVFCFTAINRLAGAGNIVAPNVIRKPNNRVLFLIVAGI